MSYEIITSFFNFLKMPRGKQVHILSLPPEILVKIFQHLSYSEIQKIRLTCKAFNDAGLCLQNSGLRKLKFRIDKVVSSFISAGWLKVNHQTIIARYLYYKRMNKGASSIMILAQMIRIADAGTFCLIQEGILPPYPGQILENFHKAIILATRRNPLVGKDRLRDLFNSIAMYLKNSDINPEVQLDQKLLFRSITDLLECLPVCKDTVQEFDYGLYFHCLLPQIPINMEFTGHRQCSGLVILNILMQLGTNAIRKFVYTDQPRFIVKDLDVTDGSVLFTDVELHVSYNSIQDRTGAVSFKELQRIEPEGFCVIVSGTGFRGQIMNEEGGLEPVPSSFTYTSSDCSSIKFSVVH